MSRNILCAVYLLIAISAVHSASYYYRAGREVIVPTIEEVKEVISELKKDEGVIVEEIVAAVPSVPVEPVVKSVPVVENVVPIVEAVETNVVADAEKAIVSDVVADEARSKPNPVLRLDTLEVIQPAGEKSDKVVTVAETVKNAAVQAIEKQNQEVAESTKIEEPAVVPETRVVVDTPVVQTVVEPVVPAVVVAPVVPTVENADASVKSVESVPVVESVVPAVEAQVVKESVRSAEPEPAKPEETAKPEEPAKPEESGKIEEPAKPEEPAKLEEPAKEMKAEVPQPTEKSVVVAPEMRQTPGPLDQLSNAITSLTSNIQHTFQNFIQGGQNAIQGAIRPPGQQQSDTPAAGAASSEEQNTAEQAPVADATQTAAATTAAPNLLQSVQQAITQFTNNIIPAQLRPTPAPAAPEAPVVVSGTRGGEETVEVVHNIDVDVNDKVDLAKKAQ